MPIYTNWLIVNRIIYSHFEGEISHDDVVQFDQAMLTMLENAEQLVHSIGDLRQITKSAPLKDTLSMKSMRHPNAGWGITIGAFENPLIRMLAAMTMAIAKARYREVSSLEEALSVLKQKDPTLPDLDVMLAKLEQKPTNP
jgi:hypothetical protein